MHRFLCLGIAVAALSSPGFALAAAPSYAVAGSIPGPNGGWDYTSVDAATRNVYVARAENVMIADPRTGTVRTVGLIAEGHAVVPLPDFNLVLVTSGHDNSVRLIDPVSGIERARIAVGNDPDAAFYDPELHMAVVINAKAGTVLVIDVASAKVVRTITLKSGLEYAQSGPDHTLFVNNEDTNEIETASLVTGKAGTAIALIGCTLPSGLAYDAKTNLLVSACANGKAAIVDVTQRKLVGLLDIGMGPDAVILDAGRRLAFVPCGQSGNLSVIALNAPGGPAVVVTVATKAGARTGAVDPMDGTLYLPTAVLAADRAWQARRTDCGIVPPAGRQAPD